MILNILYFINHTCSENTLYAKDKIDFSCKNIDYNDDDYSEFSCCDTFIQMNYNMTEDTCYPDISNNYTNIIYECEYKNNYIEIYWFIEIILVFSVLVLFIALCMFIKYYRRNSKKNNMNEMYIIESESLLNYSGPMINYTK